MKRLVWLGLCGLLPLAACNCEGDSLKQATPPTLVVTPSPAEFGDVPATLRASKTLTLKNTGEQELVVESTRLTGSAAFSTVGGPSKVAGGATAHLVVEFQPPGVAQESGTLVIVSNADGARETSVLLHGNGTEPFVCGACNAPPAAQCLSQSELLVYDPTGMCMNGECRYTARRLTCEGGCNLETASCVPAVDGGVVDAGNVVDASVPMDAGATVDAGPCDPDGVYTLDGTGVSYTCCIGLVNVSFTQLTLGGDATQVTVSPRGPALSGTGGMCPSGAVHASYVKAGGCTETYSVDLNFSDADRISGTYRLGFTGSDCGCFGGLGTPCSDQTIPFTGRR